MTGICTVVAVGSVAAMADSAARERASERGHAFGVVARHEADMVLRSVLHQADPGTDALDARDSGERPAVLGVADVS